MTGAVAHSEGSIEFPEMWNRVGKWLLTRHLRGIFCTQFRNPCSRVATLGRRSEAGFACTLLRASPRRVGSARELRPTGTPKSIWRPRRAFCNRAPRASPNRLLQPARPGTGTRISWRFSRPSRLRSRISHVGSSADQNQCLQAVGANCQHCSSHVGSNMTTTDYLEPGSQATLVRLREGAPDRGPDPGIRSGPAASRQQAGAVFRLRAAGAGHTTGSRRGASSLCRCWASRPSWRTRCDG